MGGSSTRFSSEAHLRVGRWLRSKWHLDSLIAIGGMASVYAGTHRNGARAAIKVLHAQYTRNEQARRRFLAEGYAANKVGHRNAVSVLDDDTTEDGEVYLVMELLDGESWEGRLDRVGVMSPIETLQTADQVLEVLAAAHARGILHRDIKPANIYLCRDGSVKVLDFGLARVRELSAEALDQSDGIVFGTVSYIAPEQARADNQNLDARSDMWSVAATMFRALTGETVFPIEGAVIERLMAVAKKPARSLASVNPRLPRLVIELVDRALAFDPDNRWPSANVMRVVVQDVLAQLEEEAGEQPEPEEPLFRNRVSTSNVGLPSTRSPVDPTMRARQEPDATTRRGQDPGASGRRRTDPIGVSAVEPTHRVPPEPTPTPAPTLDSGADEMDLDVENMQEAPREGKRGRARTLLTKEGRAELRRILDARRNSLGIPGTRPDPTPEPVPVPVPRVKTEPSPVATLDLVQPAPRTTTQPSPVAPPSESDSFIASDLVLDAEPSMLASSMLTMEPSLLASSMITVEPEESVIEVMIQHTRPGTIAEPIAESPGRSPGPSDSLTAAFPTIGAPQTGTPRSAGPPTVRAPGVAISPASDDTRIAARPAPKALDGATNKTTMSYPTVGGVPPVPGDSRAKPVEERKPTAAPASKSTASYPAVGAAQPSAPPPRTKLDETMKVSPAASVAGPPREREEQTRIGAAPLAPSASKPGEAAKVAAPVTASGAMRPTTRGDEAAGDAAKTARAPAPSFARPGALPSRTSGPIAAPQPVASGEVGDGDKRAGQPGSSGRFTPPLKGSSETSGVTPPPVKGASETSGVTPPPASVKPVDRPAAKVSAAVPAAAAKPTGSVAPPAPAKAPAAPNKQHPDAGWGGATMRATNSGVPMTPVAKPQPSGPVTRAPETRTSKPAEPAKPATAATRPDAKIASEAAKAKPVESAAKPVKPPVNEPPAPVARPEPTPAPIAGEATPAPLPGAGLTRPAPRKSVFSVPYGSLGKTGEAAKPDAKPEPEPGKGTPKKSG